MPVVTFGARNVGRAVVAAPPDRLESWMAGFLPAAWALTQSLASGRRRGPTSS